MPSQKKSIEQNLFYSPLFIVFLLIIIGLTVSGLFKVSYRAQKIKAETGKLQARVEELKEENKDLASQKQYYNSTHYIEKEARLQLNMKKPGESVVFIDYDESQLEREEKIKDKHPLMINFLDWIDYFFKDGK